MSDRLDRKLCLCERVGPCCHEGQGWTGSCVCVREWAPVVMSDRLDRKLCLRERVGPCCHEGQAGQAGQAAQPRTETTQPKLAIVLMLS